MTEPIEFQKKIWRDKDLAQPGDPALEALNLNRYEQIIEALVNAVNTNSGMVSKALFDAALALKFPLLPELGSPFTNPIPNKDDLKNCTTRFQISSARIQELPSAGSGVIIAIANNRESTGTLAIQSAGTNRIGFSSSIQVDLKPGDYIVLKDVVINNIGRWIRLTGPLLSETDLRYTLPGDTGFTQSDADELYEHIGTAANLISQLTKSSVGLNFVENIPPLEMPISNQVQMALDFLASQPTPQRTYTNISGDFTVDSDVSLLHEASCTNNVNIKPPSNTSKRLKTVKISLYANVGFEMNVNVDPNIVNLSLAPLPVKIGANKVITVVLSWTFFGERWNLVSIIGEP